MKKAVALAAALIFLLLSLTGCNRTEAEKMSRSYNIIISVEIDGELSGKKVELEWTVNGLNAGTKIAAKEDGKGYSKGDVAYFQLREDDLKKGMNVYARVVLQGYNGVGVACGQAIPLELELGKVYYLRVTGDNASDAYTEQIFPD